MSRSASSSPRCRSRLTATFSANPHGTGFRDTDELIGELLAAEETLAQMQSVSLASTLVRPVRWEVETFGFRSVSLDIRQNTTVINRVLKELWRKLNPLDKGEGPEPGTQGLAGLDRGGTRQAPGLPAAVPRRVG